MAQKGFSKLFSKEGAKQSIMEIFEQKVHEESEKKPKTIRKVEDIAKPVAEYLLVYDALGEGIEPIYFWVLEFMRGPRPYTGMDLEVEKIGDEFEASVGGQFFGDLSARASILQDRGMKLMETVNAVVRSIINLIYDLREFDIRLETYDDLKSGDEAKKQAADLALRTMWMDLVDIKRGRGSINQLAQQLQFVTIRDAFLYAKDEKDVDNIDLNDRVKRILKPRVSEYLKWKEHSEKELRKRYKIEKAYLKSQVNALKLYTKWAKPFFRSAQKLGMKDFNSPNIVNVFNNIEIRIGLFGKREIDVQWLIDQGTLPEGTRPTKKTYVCMEVDFVFRAVPQGRQTHAGMQFVHGGKTDVRFKAFALTEEQLKKLEQRELQEEINLVEEMTNTTLSELADDLAKYLEDDKKEEEKKKDEHINPFSALGEGLRAISEPFKSLKFNFDFSGAKGSSFIDKQVMNAAKGEAAAMTYRLYDVYKKTHGMLSP